MAAVSLRVVPSLGLDHKNVLVCNAVSWWHHVAFSFYFLRSIVSFRYHLPLIVGRRSLLQDE